MPVPVCLVHYGPYQPLWQQPGLLQAGPQLPDGPHSLQLSQPSIQALRAGLKHRGWPSRSVLLHYSDPFLMRACPLQGMRQWPGPRLLACGDLHHGPAPLDTLAAYQGSEPHDAVLLTFNPALLGQVQARLNVPVRCLAPSFFRYPAAQRSASPERVLLHLGSLGPHHPKRRALVEALQARGRIPFRHATTTSAEAAAELYARHALVLNVPLNHDLNHRVFEVMAAGTAQVVFADPSLVGPLRHLSERPDVFWAGSIEQLEALVQELFASPEPLNALTVAPPPYWALQDLLKTVFQPQVESVRSGQIILL